MADTNTPRERMQLRDGILPKFPGRRSVTAAEKKIQAEGPGIRYVYRITTVVLAVVAFFTFVVISYVRITSIELTQASAAVRTEVNYLRLQLESYSKRADAFARCMDSVGVTQEQMEQKNPQDFALFTDPIGDVLEGYTLGQTGTVVIANGDVLEASDDERLPVGGSLQELLGEGAMVAVRESIVSHTMQHINLDSALSNAGCRYGYLMAGEQGDYTIVIVESENMVFHDRGITILREAVATFFVLLAVSLVVDRMLTVAVAGRVDKINAALEKVVSGDLNARVPCGGTREFRSLSKGINVTVDALEGWIGEAERRMEADLAAARKIQEGALPKQFPAFPEIDDVDLFASMDAAREVGGDFYDFFELDDHTVALLIADVSGKGIPGALFMMAAKNEIENRLRKGVGLKQAISEANAHLCANNEAGMFVTMWVATLDWQTGELVYVNAGHNFPLLRRGRGNKWEWLKKRCGLFLGTFETAKYREETLVLEPGDELLLYTDGVNEAFNVEEQEYGNDRLEAFLNRNTNLVPKYLVYALRADVTAWAKGAERSDDITILAIEYKAGEGQ